MDTYFIVLLILGITSLFASFLPILINKLKISFTIPLLILGAFLYYINTPLPWPNPVWQIDTTLKFSEFVVIISIMVAGLKIGLNDLVLASEIQLNKKQNIDSKKNLGVQYNLTTEAGLNDGPAFPCVFLTISMV